MNATACSTSTPSRPSLDSAVLTGANIAAVRDSVKAVLTEFSTRVSEKDFAGAGKLYSDDSLFSWIENGSFSYRSAEDVRAGLETMRNIPEVRLQYHETHIDVLSSTVATVRTEFSQTFVDKPGRSTTYGGYLTMTVVREAGGWRIRNGHSSARRPRPEP